MSSSTSVGADFERRTVDRQRQGVGFGLHFFKGHSSEWSTFPLRTVNPCDLVFFLLLYIKDGLPLYRIALIFLWLINSINFTIHAQLGHDYSFRLVAPLWASDFFC